MGDTNLEKRVTDLETELAALRKKVEAMTGSKPWWERIAGTFKNDPVYEQAMKFGRNYRRAQRSNGSQPRNR
jgi:hypothetical protein